MLFAKVRVGKEVQGLYFGYFYWVSLKDFGGGGATPNLIAQFKYDLVPYTRGDKSRSISLF